MPDEPNSLTREACSTLLQEIQSGSRRTLARVVTWIEQSDPRGSEVLAEARRQQGEAHEPARIVGITGAPGSGKSTLVDQLVAMERERGHRVAVLAVDPSSPFSGGAILGDRIRMMRWHADPGVYVRSLASRGRLGGLSSGVLRIAAFLAAVGFTRILIETVGVGQSEVDIVHLADTTLVVLTPGAGDGVQAFKAGVTEIADVFVVNKADLPGADQLKADLQAAQRLVDHDATTWLPPIVLTQATKEFGIHEVHDACELHAAHRSEHGTDQRRDLQRAQAELEAAVREVVARQATIAGRPYAEAILRGELTAEEAAHAMLQEVRT